MGATMKPKYRIWNACRTALSDRAAAGTRGDSGANASRLSGWAMANTSVMLRCKSRAGVDASFRSCPLPSPNNPAPHDALDGRKRLPRGLGHRLPSRGAWSTVEVVKGQGAGAGRPADDDTAHHPGFLVWQAVVVVDPLHREGHLEVSAWRDEKPRVPGL